MGARVVSTPYFQPGDANKYSLRFNAFIDGLKEDGFVVEGGPNDFSVVGPDESKYVNPEGDRERIISEGQNSAYAEQNRAE